MKPDRALLALMSCLLAGAASAGPDPDLGASVRGNIAAQTIDMNPRYVGDIKPGDNGQRTVDAFIRYRTGKLKPLLKTNGKPDLGVQGGAGDSPTEDIPILGSSSASKAK